MTEGLTVFKSAVKLRGDSLYCPLPLYIDGYWTCEPNCEICYLRRLNRTWGNDFRLANVDAVKKQLSSKRGRSPLSQAIQQKKTIRLGNRTDPFQPCEEKYQVSTEIFKFLMESKWNTVVQTKFPARAYRMTGLNKKYSILLAEITVGLEKDWELFEHKFTENPINRITNLSNYQAKGYRVGVMGEPFIPGYHTTKQFEETLKLLKSAGLKTFNTYNLHLNDLVAKNLARLGLDIEKIWWMNQDEPWKKIQRRLIHLAKKYDIVLGCPDFVNSGWENIQECNTCCGIDVDNPCTFNTHYFKLAVQKGEDPLQYWDGVGDFSQGVRIIEGTDTDMYTLKDVIGIRKEGRTIES